MRKSHVNFSPYRRHFNTRITPSKRHLDIRAILRRHHLFQIKIKKPVIICDALRDLVAFVQFKKRKNTHGRVLLLVKS